jgi:histidine triad (HIT) family protein
MNCIFCQIVDKKIPTPILYEDENVLAFNDIHPQAPVHVLIISKQHLASIDEVSTTSSHLFSAIFQAVQTVSRQLEIAEKGYRCVINTNPEGGQTVYHLHLHLLGGTPLGGSMTGL